MEVIHSGLLNSSNYTPVSPTTTLLQGSVCHAVAKIKMTQTYKYNGDEPIQVIYWLPLGSREMVTYFAVKINNVAMNVAKDDSSIDEKGFKVLVGSVEPGVLIKVLIAWVSEVGTTGGEGHNSIQFVIHPTVVSHSTNDDSTPLTICVNVSIQGDIQNIYSPSHSIIKEEQVTEMNGWTHASVKFEGLTTNLRHHFILFITPQQVLCPRIYAETDRDYTTVMIHFIPSLYDILQKVELIFLMDEFNRKYPSSFKLAKTALLHLIHLMPADCHFNVVQCGANVKKLFSSSVKCDYRSWTMAEQHAQGLKPTFCSHGVFEALRFCANAKSIDGYPRQIIFVTTGKFQNPKQILCFCKGNDQKARLFVIGIGSSAPINIISNMAESGGGTSIIITTLQEMELPIKKILLDSMQPSLTNVKIQWTGIDQIHPMRPMKTTNSTQVYGIKFVRDVPLPGFGTYWQIPFKTQIISQNSAMIAFGVFPNKIIPSGAYLTGDSSNGEHRVQINMPQPRKLETTGQTLYQLATLKAIKDNQVLANINLLNQSTQDSDPMDPDFTLIKKRKVSSQQPLTRMNGGDRRLRLRNFFF